MANTELPTLAQHLVNQVKHLPDTQRYLVSIAGIPGAGKSTIASKLVALVNRLTGEECAILVSMDGYHWPRAVLETFPDPEETLRRRGAPHTFDAASFLALVQAIRQPLVLGGHPAAIHGPTFDHAIKDPVPNGVTIIQSHRLVVFEGLYIQLQSTPIWEEIPPLMDEQWWVECPESTCRERLINRHITSGICKNSVDAAHRADTNDIVNGRFVLKHRIVAVTNILYNG